VKTSASITALAIDYGTRSIGMAVGQSLTGTASELPVLRHQANKASQQVLLQNIKKMVQEWQADVVIVGWPLNMDGTESDFCAEVKKFTEQLSRSLSVPIEFMDERLTSYEAKTLVKQNTGFREKPVDSLAARILLENWFQQKRGNSP
jgi:putative Holliday junction resolvase